MWRIKVFYKFLLGMPGEIRHWYKCDRELFEKGVLESILNNPLWLLASLCDDFYYYGELRKRGLS